MMSPRRLLEIDLTAGSTVVHPLPPGILQQGIGGRALAVQLLGATPALDDALVIAPGALCGSGAPAANRGSIVFTSPLTGTIFTVNEGGPVPLALQRAGFAAVVVKGESRNPVLLRNTRHALVRPLRRAMSDDLHAGLALEAIASLSGRDWSPRADEGGADE